MARNWSIAITYDELADYDTQIQEIIESAARCLITLTWENAKDIHDQISYHYEK